VIYLLDTNICIYVIQHKPPEVRQHFEQHHIRDIAVSAITVAELQYGVEKSQQRARNQHALDQFLLPLTIIDFDHAAAQAYGKIRSTLEQCGTPIGALDLQIAAIALSRNLIVVTNNTREFARVPGLTVENWVS